MELVPEDLARINTKLETLVPLETDHIGISNPTSDVPGLAEAFDFIESSIRIAHSKFSKQAELGNTSHRRRMNDLADSGSYTSNRHSNYWSNTNWDGIDSRDVNTS